MTSSLTNFVYEFRHELLNDLTLKILGNWEISKELQIGWGQSVVPKVPARNTSSVIAAKNHRQAVGYKQKGESQNKCFNKSKHVKYSEKWTFLSPWYAYQGVKNFGFSENLACFAFLKHPFWDLPFCRITDETDVKVFYVLSIFAL